MKTRIIVAAVGLPVLLLSRMLAQFGVHLLT